MLVCPKDLENGGLKMLPNQTTLLGTSPGFVSFSSLLVLKAFPYKPPKFVCKRIVSLEKYNSLEETTFRKFSELLERLV